MYEGRMALEECRDVGDDVMERLEKVCRERGSEGIKGVCTDIIAKNETYIRQSNLCIDRFNKLKEHLTDAQLAMLLDYSDEVAHLESVAMDILAPELVSVFQSYFTPSER